MRKRILTGDRPTGKLHLGHFAGSLKNRLKLQDEFEVTILVADLHSLTTKSDTKDIKDNIRDLIIDQIAVGIDPEKVSFALQSAIPEDTELAVIFSMLVSKSRLERIPTLKDILRDLKIDNPSLGLLSYPVLMAADILMIKSNLVPVGKDQASHIELTREIAEKFNTLYGEVFPLPEALIPEDLGTLPGTDGKTKMSKSLDNAIYLSDDGKAVSEKVMRMYTDPTRIKPTDPGHVEGNPVFIYLDQFGTDPDQIKEYKEKYQKGQVGDVEVKKYLVEVLNQFLQPIRERRGQLLTQEGLVEDVLTEGTAKTRKEAQTTLAQVRKAIGLP
jgi:tryptophanyl-tRNA synthetase